MKKLFVLSLISLFCVTLYAQDEKDKPNFISINVGPSIPLKDYQAIDSIGPANAKVGLSLSLESGLYLNKVLGIGFGAGVFTNPIDVNDLSSQYQTQVGNNGVVTTTANNWVNFYGMVGPYLSIGGKVLMVDLKFLGGIVNSTKPQITTTTDLNGQTESRVSAAESATSFGFNYGAHLRLKLVGPLSLRVNVEGVSTKQEFDNNVEYIKNNTTQQLTQEKIKTEFKSLNLGVGLLINL